MSGTVEWKKKGGDADGLRPTCLTYNVGEFLHDKMAESCQRE